MAPRVARGRCRRRPCEWLQGERCRRRSCASLCVSARSPALPRHRPARRRPARRRVRTEAGAGALSDKLVTKLSAAGAARPGAGRVERRAGAGGRARGASARDARRARPAPRALVAGGARRGRTPLEPSIRWCLEPLAQSLPAGSKPLSRARGGVRRSAAGPLAAHGTPLALPAAPPPGRRPPPPPPQY